MTKPSTEIRRWNSFEYGYIASPDDMYGTMTPFSPHWWAQYLHNGAWHTTRTKAEIMDWMKEYLDV